MAASKQMRAALKSSTLILCEELRVQTKSYCVTEGDVDSIRDAADREHAQSLIDAIAMNEIAIAAQEVRNDN